jgi:sugar transferase (PEP-CTERM system associated)
MLKSIPKKKIVLLIGDIVIIAASIYIAPLLRYGTISDPWSIFTLSNLVPTFVYVFIFYLYDLYNMQRSIDKIDFALKFALAIFAINIINASLFYLLHLRPYSSWILFNSSLLTLIFLLLWRLFFSYLVFTRAKPLCVCILGAGNTGKKLYDLLKSHPDYSVIGFVDDDRNKQGMYVDGLPVLGRSDNLEEIIRNYEINKIVVCISGEIRPDVFPKLVEAKFHGVAVYEMPTFYEKIAGKIPVLHTNNMWMGYADVYGVKNNLYNSKIKKVLDIFLAGIILVIALPVMILTAALIKLESKGAVFYIQKRVGLDEKIFSLFKFRSMLVDAEGNGAVWAQENDPRLTRVGKMIRKCRIDELPQLWNVLKRDMSFVGPRPERPEFVNFLQKSIPYYMLRHSVKPGITGWAQVNYRYGDSLEDAQEKLQFDLYYIKNESFILDLHIMLRTVRVVLFGIGGR